MTWSSAVLNSFVAPNYCDFTQVEISELTADFPEAPHWLGNHFLNSVLRGRHATGFRQAALGFLRRVNGGFQAYHEARRLTLAHLSAGTPHEGRVVSYYAAVNAWEGFTLQMFMATDVACWLIQPEKVFKKNDGSGEERLSRIANHVKHVGDCIKSGQCTERDILPLWLSNEGIESFDNVRVSWAEAAEVLRDYATFANKLQDPVNFVKEAS